MMDQKKWMGTMLDITRASFEAGMRNMDTYPKQAEKAMNLAAENASIAQDETRKVFDTWRVTLNTARQAYTEIFNEGLTNLEQQFTNISAKRK